MDAIRQGTLLDLTLATWVLFGRLHFGDVIYYSQQNAKEAVAMKTCGKVQYVQQIGSCKNREW